MKIGSLLFYADDDRFMLPPFARSASWTPSQVMDLLKALYHEFPVGGLVVWSTCQMGSSGAYPHRAVRSEVIVDGAQRIAGIYTAIRGRAPRFATGGTAIQACFNAETEEFAIRDAVGEADNARWIKLPEFFASRNPAIGAAYTQLEATHPTHAARSTYLMHLQRLANLVERSLCVEYMPPETSLEHCREVYVRLNRCMK